MKLKHFLDSLEHDRVHQTIQAAEKGTSARIVVYISHKNAADPMLAAQAVFKKLGLETAEKKTGLLFFVAPKTQKFAVLGGTALHEKLGQIWWDRLSDSLRAHFQRGSFTDGLVAALEEAGRDLKTHFPSAQSRPGGEIDLIEN
jgi:uncharacterized membrane protein